MNESDPSEELCRHVRGYLDDYLSHEASAETNRVVVEHLRTCIGCLREAEIRLTTRKLLRRAVGSQSAPAPLRQRIEAEIHKQPVPFWKLNFSPRWALAAAALVAAVVLSPIAIHRWRLNRLYEDRVAQDAYIRAVDAQLPRVVAIGMADHLHCAVFRRYPQAYPQVAVAADTLGPEFTHLVDVVKSRIPGEYRVVMAHRCSYAGRRYVHLVLKSDSNLVSLVMTEKQAGETFADLSRSSESGTPVAIYETGAKHFQIAGFESGQYLAFVVSDLNEKSNLQIAENAAPAMTQLLDSMKGVGRPRDPPNGQDGLACPPACL